MADWLVIAIAASLPWSTSATGILIALWLAAFCLSLITLLGRLSFASIRQEALVPAAALPMLLWLIAGFGMLWADVAWTERFAGFESFGKLLAIPLLLAHFRRSNRAKWVFTAFLVSCTILLAISFYLAFWPGLTWRGRPDNFAVLVKDYIAQSGEFVICAFALLSLALRLLPNRPWIACALFALAVLFLANVLYVSSGRTAWVVAAALLIVFAIWQFEWQNACLILVGAILCAWLVWQTSPYLRSQINSISTEFHGYTSDNAWTRIGLRLEFWKKSISFVREAPMFGQGTGSTKELFRRSAVGEGGASAAITNNPHNQTLAVAIQLGLLGVGLLYAMWAAHFLMFFGSSSTAWFGLVIVLQNIVSCLFNSHLFDFTQGWTYVFGVGVAGGTLLRSKPPHRITVQGELMVPVFASEKLERPTDRRTSTGPLGRRLRDCGGRRAIQSYTIVYEIEPGGHLGWLLTRSAGSSQCGPNLISRRSRDVNLCAIISASVQP